MSGASQHCWESQNNVGTAGTMLEAPGQCESASNIVGGTEGQFVNWFSNSPPSNGPPKRWPRSVG